jgi:hypothetical protein
LARSAAPLLPAAPAAMGDDAAGAVGAAAGAAAAVAEEEERHRLGKLCESACKKYACAIQYCLERHHYQEKRCWREVGDWNSCCERIKAREREARAAAAAAGAPAAAEGRIER